MTDRSLRTIVTDSFTAPRWVHHGVKAVTGALVLLLLALLERYGLHATPRVAWAVASLLSVAWFLSLRVSYWLDHRGDAQPAIFIKADLWCDLALHSVPAAIAIALVSDRMIGSIAFALCVAGYLSSYPDATP
jgi:hypothetical protein